MALKTFTTTRAPAAGDGKYLKAWHLACSADAVVNFCDGTSATPMFQVKVVIANSASQSYSHPGIAFPNGVHVEVVSGTLTRGAIDV